MWTKSEEFKSEYAGEIGFFEMVQLHFHPLYHAFGLCDVRVGIEGVRAPRDKDRDNVPQAKISKGISTGKYRITQ
jgi:hypothetical protein